MSINLTSVLDAQELQKLIKLTPGPQGFPILIGEIDNKNTSIIHCLIGDS